MKTVRRNEEKHRLQIWDAAGDEKYRFLTQNMIKNVDCALIVLDVSSED